jgi:hypothetical protein
MNVAPARNGGGDRRCDQWRRFPNGAAAARLTLVATVIDLGIAGEDPPPRPGPGPALRWLAGQHRVVAVVLAVLGCAGLGASAAHSSPYRRVLWSARVAPDVLALGEQTIYAARPGEGIVALRLSDGALRWRLSAGTPFGIDESGSGQALVVTSAPAGLVTSTVDIVSGATTGTQSGQPVAIADGGHLVVLTILEQLSADAPAETTELVAVRPADGHVAWRLPVPYARFWFDADASGQAHWLVLPHADGRLGVRDIRTGAEVAATTSSVIQLVGALSRPVAAVAGGTLVIAGRGTDGLELAAYSLPDLQPAWRAPMPATGLAEAELNGDIGLRGCAGLVCLRRPGSTLVFAPGDGGTLMDTDGVVNAPFGREWVSVLDGAAPPSVEIYDRNTGRRTATYPGWRMVVDETATGPADRPALLARDHAGRTYFASISPGSSQLRLLGSEAGTDLHCGVRSTTLACLDSDGGLRVWQQLTVP